MILLFWVRVTTCSGPTLRGHVDKITNKSQIYTSLKILELTRITHQNLSVYTIICSLFLIILYIILLRYKNDHYINN